jgi:hypothetical protein
VRGYFDSHAFQSIATADFVDYLNKNLITANPQSAKLVSIEDWIYQPGLPVNAPQPASDAFVKIEAQAKNYTSGKIAANKIQTRAWTTQEWLHFLKTLPQKLSAEKMAELDGAFNLTARGNSEITFQWLLMSIRNDYETAFPRLEEFLTTIGRRKFVKPLFEELAKTPEGTKRAAAIYVKARPGYHPITVASIDAVLKPKT